MNVILYSTGCPKCVVLKNKLTSKGIGYKEVNDIEYMTELGFMEVPVLEVDGERMNFVEANDWVNGLKN